MKLSDNSLEALRVWLRPGTWHTGHPCDEERFHLFVHEVWEQEKKVWDEAYIREVMLYESKELQPIFNQVERERVIDNHRSTGTEILDFLSTLKKNGKR